MLRPAFDQSVCPILSNVMGELCMNDALSVISCKPVQICTNLVRMEGKKIGRVDLLQKRANLLYIHKLDAKKPPLYCQTVVSHVPNHE
jgi:hypothetical protein